MDLTVDIETGKRIAEALSGLETSDDLEFTCTRCERPLAFRPRPIVRQGGYEDAVFWAFVWTQAVEKELRDMAGELELCGSRKGLGRLVEVLQPHLDYNHIGRLKRLVNERNELIHGFAHIANMWSHLYCRPAASIMDEEIRRFNGIAVRAEQLLEELRDR